MNKDKPFWWPDMQGFAVCAIVLITGGALFVRMFHGGPQDDKMLDTMITIMFSTCLVTVYNFLFGSSRSSAAKDDTLNKIAGTATNPPIPPNDITKASAIALMIVVGAALMWPGQSFAATAKRAKPAAKPAAVAVQPSFTDGIKRVTVSVSGGKQLTRVYITKQKAIDNPISVIQTFTAADIQAALDDANANGDTVSAQCWAALLPIVQTGIGNPLPAGLGAFQALQKARDLQRLAGSINAPGGPMDKLNTACAPVILSTQNTLIQLGIIGGGVALAGGTGGLTLPTLPGLLSALGIGAL